VLYNRVGSDNHASLLSAAHASVPGLPPLLGCLPRSEVVALPERHLGLVTAGDIVANDTYAQLAGWIAAHVDLDRLLAALEGPSTINDAAPAAGDGVPPDKVRIGVARDAAFCFCYPENLEWLERAGAELAFFSPLAESLPPDLAGLYLPGGYPELHLERLAANRVLTDEIRTAADIGLPVYAECGGLLLLTASFDGTPLAGVFPATARLLPKRKALGYREVTMTAVTPLGPAGTVARGHEYHYSEMEMPAGIPRVYRLAGRDGMQCGTEGYLRGNVLGSYVHLHFGSNPQLAEHFVACCRKWREEAR
jgi:cobyrinic acid a,c-diamide synthase